MKKNILIICILITNLFFSQKKDSYTSGALIEASAKENYLIEFTVSTEIKKMISEISLIDFKKFRNNSEGKFIVSDKNNVFFLGLDNETNSLIHTSYVRNSDVDKLEKINKPVNLVTDVKKEFIEKTILKKIQEDLKKYMSIYESMNYGDRNIDLYRNYESLLNNLIVEYKLSKNTSVQLGKSVYPFLTKMLKTEIDNTQNSSLNLVAINF